MWLVTVLLISVCYCNLSVADQTLPNSCPTASADGSVSKEVSSSATSGFSSNLLNLRYSRSILSANTQKQKKPTNEHSRYPREINAKNFNEGTNQQSGYGDQGNSRYYRPNGQELEGDGEGTNPSQIYSRPPYTPYSGSLAQPTFMQSQNPSTYFNQGIPSTHTFGARSCPYCNSHLPPEPVYQHQHVTAPRSYQYQQSPQVLVNPFAQQQQYQYAIVQGPVGYQNINPAYNMKTVPTVPAEEMCPYSNGGAPSAPQISRQGFNETLEQASDASAPPGAGTPVVPAVEYSSYIPVKSSPISRGSVIRNNLKSGPSSLQRTKLTKMQKTESLTTDIDSDNRSTSA